MGKSYTPEFVRFNYFFKEVILFVIGRTLKFPWFSCILDLHVLRIVGPYLVQKRIWYNFVPYSAEYGTTV